MFSFWSYPLSPTPNVLRKPLQVMSVICNFRTTRILSNEITDFMYLLHERKFVVRNEHVYKIWRTTQLNQYQKNSCISYFQSYCSNCIICEKKMFDLFDKKYKRRLDIRGELGDKRSGSTFLRKPPVFWSFFRRVAVGGHLVEHQYLVEH